MKQEKKNSKKNKKEDSSPKKVNENSSLYEQSYERLFFEIKNFKNKYYKKESSKQFKTLYFTKFIESNNYSLNLSNINLIWSNHIFEPEFLSDLNKYPDYEQPIQYILKLLCGDFSKSIKIHKMQKHLRDFEKKINIYIKQKLASFYSIKLSKDKKHILFSLCLQNDEYSQNITASVYLYFISITEEWNFDNICLDFINNKILTNDDKYPFIEFDKTGLFMSKELIFQNTKNENCIKINFPLNNLSTEKSKIFKTEIINKKKYEYYNDETDFILDEINQSIMSQIESEELENIIKDTIDGKFWKDIKLSNQEKEKIYQSNPILISGRPGTGKTTIILVKLFSIYYDFFLKMEKGKNISNL